VVESLILQRALIQRDRLALVTGTSSGIGAAVARRLLENHWTVIGIARRPASFDTARYRHLALDLSNVEAACECIEREVGPMFNDKRFSRATLVNNAGVGDLLGPAERIPPGDLQRMLAVNVTAPVWLMGFLLRHGSAGVARRIVNVSSGAGVRAFPGLAAYSASKAALRMAGMVLAEELSSPERSLPNPDVAILSYEPGIVDTDMQTRARSLSADTFPWVGLFHQFAERGMLVPPDAPAAEIVEFVEADGQPRFSERRLTG
jgi:benzil reductase ((S)-benzoin forming)